MSTFRTPAGEFVEARGAMAGLFRKRGWTEVQSASLPDSPPLKSAAKSAWVEYAKAVGVDAEGLTRNQIIEAVSGLD